jgi:hypothetical protein
LTPKVAPEFLSQSSSTDTKILLQNWSQSFQLGITNLLWNFLS